MIFQSYVSLPEGMLTQVQMSHRQPQMITDLGNPWNSFLLGVGFGVFQWSHGCHPISLECTCSLRKAKAETPQETPAAAEASNCDIWSWLELWFGLGKCQANVIELWHCESLPAIWVEISDCCTWCSQGDTEREPQDSGIVWKLLQLSHAGNWSRCPCRRGCFFMIQRLERNLLLKRRRRELFMMNPPSVKWIVVFWRSDPLFGGKDGDTSSWGINGQPSRGESVVGHVQSTK